MHKSEGLRWSSWAAHATRDADDARAKQAELLARYGRPNTTIATSAASATAPPEP